MLWAADVCSWAAFAQPRPFSPWPFSLIHWAGFSQLEDWVSWVAGFVRHPGLSHNINYHQCTRVKCVQAEDQFSPWVAGFVSPV